MSIISGVNDPMNHTFPKNNTASDSNASDLQNNFLKLLVVQLQNQDPTNPMDNQQLTSQLAQINTVSGIEKLNTTLSSVLSQINSQQSLDASTLIGKGVMIEGSQILTGNGSTTPFGIRLEEASDKTTVSVQSASGETVRTLQLGSMCAGVHHDFWDGTLEDGSTAPDGAYTFTLSSTRGDNRVVAQPLNYARVNGVTPSSDGARLDLGTKGMAMLNELSQIL